MGSSIGGHCDFLGKSHRKDRLCLKSKLLGKSKINLTRKLNVQRIIFGRSNQNRINKVDIYHKSGRSIKKENNQRKRVYLEIMVENKGNG